MAWVRQPWEELTMGMTGHFGHVERAGWRMAWLGLAQRQETNQETLPINSGHGLSSGPHAAPQRTSELEGTLIVTQFRFLLHS